MKSISFNTVPKVVGELEVSTPSDILWYTSNLRKFIIISYHPYLDKSYDISIIGYI